MSETMASDKFWHLKAPEERERALWRRGEVQFETVTCSKNAGHQRSGKRLTQLTVDLPSIRQNSMIWTVYGECLVDNNTRELFLAHKLSGFSLRSVLCYENNRPLASTTYWELVVTGWGGMASTESGVRLIESCSFCSHQVYSCFTNPSKLVDVSRWDRSDFFMVWPLPRYVFVTDKVKSVAEMSGITGGKFAAVKDLDCAPDDTLTPGRLSDWLSKENIARLRRQDNLV